MILVRKAKKKILTPDHTQAEAWVYQSPATPKITFNELMEECSLSCGEHPNKTMSVTMAFVNRICHYLEIGRSVEIEGIGTFKPVIRSKAYDSKEAMEAPADAVKEVTIRFYPHKPLQKAIQSNGCEYDPTLDD